MIESYPIVEDTAYEEDMVVVRVTPARACDEGKEDKILDRVSSVLLVNGIYLIGHETGGGYIVSTFNSTRFELDIA